MGKVKRTIKLLVVGLIISVGFVFIFKMKYSNSVTIKKWDNIYNENNITFFYAEKEDEKIKILKQMYSIEEKLEGEKDKIQKAIKTSEILNEIITFDDISNTKGINGYDILKEKNGAKKASARDLGIIYRDFLESLGYIARLGEFRRTDVKLSKQSSYYVVEFWSKEDNKWIMIDFIDRGYFDKEGFPCSAMELIEEDIRNLNYKGNSDRRDYIPMLKKSLYTYTISIDNSTDMKKSNTNLTYVKNENDITLKFKGNYIAPTIFTQNKDLMNKNPIDKAIKNDKKAYIVLMKKQDKTSLEEETENNSYIIGAFKDGKIMDEYYIKENENGFRKVKKYSDTLLTKGDNLIELSLDGEDVVSSIEIDFRQ